MFCQSTNAENLLQQGEQLIYDGYYDSTIRVLKKAMLSYQRSETDKIVKTYYALGEGYLNIGKCDSASLVINQGLDQATDEFLLAEGYYVLAKAMGGCSNRWKEAKQTLNKSTAIKKKIYGTDSPEISFNYNLMGYFHIYSAAYDSALIFLDKALIIRTAHPEMDPFELSATYLYLGKVYVQKGDLKEALKYALQALDIRRKLLRKNHPSTSNALSDVGNTYKGFGNYERALSYFKQALDIRKKTLGDKHINVAASYYNMGSLYGNMFDYRRAIPFIEQGNLILEDKFGDQTPVLHTYYAYLGLLYHKAGEAIKGQKTIERALFLSEKYLPQDHPYRATIYNIAGQYYAGISEFDRQQSLYSEALKIYKKLGQRTGSEADILFGLGKSSLEFKDFKQARMYFNESLNIYISRLGKKNDKVSTVYQKLGDLEKNQGDITNALDNYWLSLHSLALDEFERNVTFDLHTLTHKQKALTSLHRIANIHRLRFEQTSDINELSTSLQLFNKGIELLDLIGSEFQLEDSRAQLAKDTRSFFNDAVKTAHLLYEETGEEPYKKALYYIIEKSKSPILSARIQENEARRFSGVPDSVINRERDIRVELSYFKEKLRDAKAASNEEKIAFYQTEVFQTQNAYEQFKERLKDEYSDYYAYRYENHIIEPAGVHALLPPGTLLLEYYEGTEDIYTLAISDKAFDVYRYSANDNIKKAIKGYRRSLTDNALIVDNPSRADSLFVSSSHFLFKELIEPAIEEKMDVEKLLLIPDGSLSKLSFGTFLTQPAPKDRIEYDRLNYLLNDYDISYAYSVSLNFSEKDEVSNFRFAGFAPSYKAAQYADLDSSKHPMAYELVRDGKLPLPGAIAEVQEISDLVGGRIWINQEASESNFKAHAGEYKIIHLAMHSLLNSEDPEYSELLFNHEQDSLNDGYLTIDEIYNLDLNASLVVLSACSSGGGTFQEGEGPISFTRAFSYVGCPSVVMSMWKLPDESTHQIMVEFYKNLKAGDAKDEALRKAQLHYLKNTNDPLYQHPFFWGSFVALGDMSPISDTNTTSKVLIYILVFLLAVILFFRGKIFPAKH